MARRPKKDYQAKIRRVGQGRTGDTYLELELRRGDEPATRCHVPLSDLSNGARALIDAVTDAGIVIATQKARNELLDTVQMQVSRVERIRQRKDFEVADIPGWYGAYYVSPSRVHFGSDGRTEQVKSSRDRTANIVFLVNGVDQPERWRPAGAAEAWQKMASAVGKGNALPVFGVCAALMGPLLELRGLDGTGILLVAEAGMGKTTLSRLIASVFKGDARSKLGGLDSWFATENAFQLVAKLHRHGLFVPDDLAHLPGDTRKKAEVAADLIFLLVSGGEKRRFTDSAPKVDWRLVFWATSNFSLKEILERGGKSFDAAYYSRFIEIPAFGPKGCVFERIPEGMTVGSFSKKIGERVRENYGHVGDEFIDKLVDWRRSDEKRLKRWIDKRMDWMRSRLDLDEEIGADARVAEYFCLAYAAGSLGVEFGVLPWTRKQIGEAVVRCYQAHQQHLRALKKEANPLERLKSYITSNRADFKDVRRGPISLAEEDFISAPGFIVNRAGKAAFAFRPSQFHSEFGGSPKKSVLLDALAEANLLDRDGDKNSRRCQIRSGARRDRMYCITAKILPDSRLTTPQEVRQPTADPWWNALVE